MGKTAILGVVLIVLGIGGLLFSHFSYTETKPLLKAGPLQVNSQEEHTISIPTIGSIVLLIAGASLVIAGRRAA
jgi:Na+/proline symporter